MRRESELARLAWLNRIPIAMSSGRINRNVSNCLGETVGGWRERSPDEDRSPNMCLIAWSVFGATRAIGWHRTTKANVGSRLTAYRRDGIPISSDLNVPDWAV